MKPNVLDQKIMIQYLLGQLSEDERAAVEELFFENDTYFEQLSALEDDLIDDYARGRLSVDLQKGVQARLRSDVRWRQRVVFAEALAQKVAVRESPAMAPARRESFFHLLLQA